MWQNAQIIIRKLESQMLLASQYLISKLTTRYPTNHLTGVAGIFSNRTLTQTPGVRNRAIYVPYNPWIVR
jgi:hypothetical protein